MPSAINEVVHIPAAPADDFLRRIDYLNKRARRLGLRLQIAVEEVGRESRSVVVSKTVFQEGRQHRITSDEIRPCVLYRVACPEPSIKLSGYHYAGLIAAKNAERDVITGEVRAHSFTPFPDRSNVSSDVIDRAFNSRGMMCCDHCGTFRNRRFGIVIADDAGNHKIVGSACVRDYLGHDPKAVVSYFQHIVAFRAEYDAQAKVGWYALHEYDFAAEARARAEAAARRDAVVYPLRRIVGAVLFAMAEQGFYARYDGPGKRATSERVRELLADHYSDDDPKLGNLSAVMGWMRSSGGFCDLPSADDAAVALSTYLACDPEFRVVDDYRRATGNPLQGRFLEDASAPLRVTCCSREYGEIEIMARTGTRYVDSLTYTFEDEVGSVLVWQTQSERYDGLFERGQPVDATFEVKRRYLDGVRAVNVVRRMKLSPAPQLLPPEEDGPSAPSIG